MAVAVEASQHLDPETARRTPESDLLFVGHEATWTGAPTSLLRLARWVRDNTDHRVRILLLRGGPRLTDYEAVAPTRVLHEQPNTTNKLIRRLLNSSKVKRIRRRLHERRIRRWCKKSPPAVIYINTVAAAPVLPFLSFLDAPVATHVRELETALHAISACSPIGIDEIRRRTVQFLAVSNAVKASLVQNLEITVDRVKVRSGCVDLTVVSSCDGERSKERLCAEAGIAVTALIVGGVGSFKWHKGADLFVQLCGKINEEINGRPVHFIWIGDGPAASLDHLKHDAAKLGISNRIHFLGRKPNALEYVCAFDIFALMSREDSFPLSMLEAGMFGKPIVCFKDSGGASEFVADGCGFCVDYMDVNAMAESVMRLLSDARLRSTLGRQAAENVESKYDVKLVGAEFVSLLESLVAGQNRLS